MNNITKVFEKGTRLRWIGPPRGDLKTGQILEYIRFIEEDWLHEVATENGRPFRMTLNSERCLKPCL